MYFPKSQIKSNLYTNGGEYVLSTTKEDYKGYYYEVSTGQRFTGTIIVTGYTVNSSMDGMVEASISFQGSGATTYSTGNTVYP